MVYKYIIKLDLSKKANNQVVIIRLLISLLISLSFCIKILSISLGVQWIILWT